MNRSYESSKALFGEEWCQSLLPPSKSAKNVNGAVADLPVSCVLWPGINQVQ